MVLYIEDHLFLLVVQAFVWVPTLIMGILTILNVFKTEGRLRLISLYFALFSFSLSGTYISWSIRAAFHDTVAPVADWFIFWAMAYQVGVLGFYFIILWALSLLRPELLEERKWLYVLLIIPWLVVLLDVFIVNNPTTVEIISFAGVNDINPDLILQGASGFAVIVYAGSSILLFGRYLLASENKGTTNYRKIYLIEIGLVLFTFGTFFDATKLLNTDLAMFLVRTVIAVGTIVMFFGFRLPNRFHVS